MVACRCVSTCVKMCASLPLASMCAVIWETNFEGWLNSLIGGVLGVVLGRRQTVPSCAQQVMDSVYGDWGAGQIIPLDALREGGLIGLEQEEDSEDAIMNWVCAFGLLVH